MKDLARSFLPVVAVLVAIVAGVLMVGWVDWDKTAAAAYEFMRTKQPPEPPKPKVLLVSEQDADRYIVMGAMEPRGYALDVVKTAQEAQDVLTSNCDRVDVVVVDMALPSARKILQASKSACPRAYPIELRGRRESSELSAQLVAHALN